MALINCSECGKQVSDQAPACPSCGNPILQSEGSAAIKTETQITSVQYTSKKRKRDVLWATGSMIVGFFMFLNGFSSLFSKTPHPVIFLLGILLTGGGIIAAVVARIRIWWDHG